MPGKVFISCGQATPEERKIATVIRRWLKGKGFEPYVAIETQSIQDVNSCIIGNLRSADYYIFIDFRREKICNSPKEYRGSLFTNQELAIAYILGFDQVLFIQHSDIKLEGIGKYILSNARRFVSPNEVTDIVKEEVVQRGWKPDYSRQLVPVSIDYFHDPDYREPDGTARYDHHIWRVEIRNNRNDAGAFSTVARLKSIDDLSKGITIPSISYFLKWAGQSGYERTILPKDSAKFDAFAIENKPAYNCIYLHSSKDIHPRKPIMQDQLGQLTLNYQVFAQGFPVLEFAVKLELTGNITATTVRIV